MGISGISSWTKLIGVLVWIKPLANGHSGQVQTLLLAATGVQVLIYMGQMRPASSSLGGSVNAIWESHTDFHS